METTDFHMISISYYSLTQFNFMETPYIKLNENKFSRDIGLLPKIELE